MDCDIALDNLLQQPLTAILCPIWGQIPQSQTPNIPGQAALALMLQVCGHRGVHTVLRMSPSAQGAGMALPNAIAVLWGGSGATAASAQQPQQLPLLPGAQNRRGNRGRAGSSEFPAASRARQCSGTIPGARQMLAQELSLMG